MCCWLLNSRRHVGSDGVHDVRYGLLQQRPRDSMLDMPIGYLLRHRGGILLFVCKRHIQWSIGKHLHQLRQWHVQRCRILELHGLPGGHLLRRCGVVLYGLLERQVRRNCGPDRVHQLRRGDRAKRHGSNVLFGVQNRAIPGQLGSDEVRRVPRRFFNSRRHLGSDGVHDV